MAILDFRPTQKFKIYAKTILLVEDDSRNCQLASNCAIASEKNYFKTFFQYRVLCAQWPSLISDLYNFFF